MSQKTSTHHIIPTSRGGSNEKVNKIILPAKTHNQIHRLFSNQTPMEQLKEVLEMNRKVYNPDVAQYLWHVLSVGYNGESEKDMYKKDAFNYLE